MSLRIANNVSSLTAQNNLRRASTAMSSSLEKLSSGFKINRGADGPAALVISEKQRAQIAGLTQAIENSEKAVSVVQTAEGALNEINSLLVKVRSLALDSANSGVNDADALAANQAEITNALETIDRIASNTQFGTKKLLNGSAGISGTPSDADVSFLKGTATTIADTYTVSVGTAAERAKAEAGTAQTAVLAADETLTVNNIDISLTAGMTQDQVVARINEFSSQTGVSADKGGTSSATRLYSNQFGADASISAVSNVAAAADSSGIGTTAITDTGANAVVTITSSDGSTTSANSAVGKVVTVTGGPAKGMVLQLAEDSSDPTDSVSGAQGTVSVVNNSLVFQIGPNQNQTASLAINRVSPNALAVGVSSTFSSLNDISVQSASDAQESIGVIDAAIDEITNQRGTLGAFQQNTLESTASNLRTTLENSVNAESVIRDTDFAAEIAQFTKQQVLVQAGTSLLGTANQTSQLVLSLL